jgi:quinolinate synthase
MLQREEVLKLKKKYPDALVLAHPECNLEVLKISDYVGSTKGIINFAHESDKKEFIIATEAGVLHQMKKNDPDKIFHMASSRLICPNMKLTTLEEVYECLKNEANEVFVDQTIANGAKKSLDKMMELSKKLVK